MIVRALSFLLLLSVGLPALAVEKIHIAWPGSKVSYFLYSPQNGTKGGLAIGLKDGKGPTWLVPGQVRYLPFEYTSPEDTRYFHSMSATYKEKPEVLDHYAAVVIDDHIYIMDSVGRVIQMPDKLDLPLNEVSLQVLYNASPKGMKISYKKAGGGRRLYVYTANHTLHDLGVNQYHTFGSSFTVDYATGVIKTDDLTVNLHSSQVSDAIVIDKTKKKTLGEVEPIVEIASIDPIQKLRDIKDERLKLLADMKKEIIGQDPALEQFVRAYAQTKTHDMKKPKVVIALGPSGTGKTFTAQVFAKLKAEGKVLEISGNEYNSHAGALDYHRLLGSHKGDGELITWLKDNKGIGTLVINEGDKMNPEIWLKLMEFLNTGILRDAKGEIVQAHDLVIFITTNRGVARMFPSSAKSWTQAEIEARLRSMTQQDLKNYFLQKDGLKDAFNLPPEVLNRIDEWLAYGPVTNEAAVGIATAEANSLRAQYKEKFTVDVTIEPEVLKHLALTGFDASIDAREVRSRVSRIFLTLVDDALDALSIKSHDKINVTLITNAQRQKELKISTNGKSFMLPAPSSGPVDPLTDPTLKTRLLDLEKEMGKEVIGQTEAIAEIADAVLSHSGRAVKTRPFIAYLGGISGNGKTETGRALANARYGSASSVRIIPMGNIQNQQGFESVFGSAAQMQGGDIERLFEKALREMPNGGVIILDEISNMGAGDLNLKTSLLMKLYDLFEEGRYVSPMDNREYNLGKYHFILTGNDGEKDFKNITADDLLLQTWKDIKKPEKVRAMLVDSGWPPALLNRIPVKVLMKPLLSNEIDQVTEKLWKREVTDFLSQRPGLEIELSPGFMTRLGRAFFTADQGGRSVRTALENRVNAILVRSLAASPLDMGDLRGVKIVVDIEDKKTLKSYITKATPAREVNFKTVVLKDGKPVHSEVRDVTESAVSQVLLSHKNAILTAYHEAGHAVANDPEVTGEDLRFITIRGGKTSELTYYGYASYIPRISASGSNPGHAQVVARIARYWAGRMAQELGGFKSDAGWSQDLKMIRSIAGKYLTTWGLDDQLIGLTLDKDGNPVVGSHLAELYQKRYDALLTEAKDQGERRAKEQWPLIRAVTAELLKKGDITQERFAQIQSRFNYQKTQAMSNSQRRAGEFNRVTRLQAVRCEDMFKPVSN